jgi:hypothetical protein
MSDTGNTQAVRMLTGQVNDLTLRVSELERAVTELGGDVRRATTARPAPTTRPLPPPVARPTTPAPRPRPIRTPPPRPRREPTDWPAVAERIFAARTLAWAGGTATVLGIVLLFVMASSRGWITPGMRVGIGALASFGLLGFAFELDRRKVRVDAILSAGGAGIAGLYASLWASIALYGLIGRPSGLALAGAIAALAVALGIRIGQEPLAIFGVVAAMLAPTLVSEGVTGAGALFSLVIACAGLPLYLRYRWETLVVAVWLAAAGTLVALFAATDPGPSAAVLAGAGFWALFTAEAVVIELRRTARDRISELGWLLLGSSLTLAFATSFVYADDRVVAGHRLAGLVLIGVTLAYGLLAVTPALARRRHADLEDVLAAFGLSTLATATGLLTGGPGQVCAWAAESVVLVALAERLLRRSGTRRIRLVIASGAYLTLAVVATGALTTTDSTQLQHIGGGSTDGAIALVAVTIAGIVYCYGTRFATQRELQALWLVPAGALGYLTVWALEPEAAVCAYAGLSAAVFAYRRSSWMVAWLDDQVAVLVAACYWSAGLAVSAFSAAPLEAIGQGRFGGRDGLLGIALLVGSGCVGAWSVRRPALPGVEYAVLIPAATFGYLICEATTQHRAMWAALAVTAVAAGAGHVPAVRRRVGEWPLVAAGAGYLAAALAGLVDLDGADRAIVDHGRSSGWGTLAIAVAVGFLLATAVREPRLRGYAIWLPAALAGWLAALVLPGQYPLVVWAMVSGAAALVVLRRPAFLRSRISPRPLCELAGLVAAGVAVLVLIAYETPHMLFTANHTPARNLAAAVASVLALALVAAAAPDRWRVGGVRVAGASAVAACAMALWTLAAAILGAFQLPAETAVAGPVNDAFQRGHVMVSVSWVLIGLVLVVASLRGDRRRLRIVGVALLFAALGKLFLYDLAFLTAMARAVSFIVTGSVLLVAAVLLQRFAPQVKDALSDDELSREATA